MILLSVLKIFLVMHVHKVCTCTAFPLSLDIHIPTLIGPLWLFRQYMYIAAENIWVIKYLENRVDYVGFEAATVCSTEPTPCRRMWCCFLVVSTQVPVPP